MMKTLALGALLLSTQTFANNKVIYGPDNRHDVYDSPTPQYAEWARSTAAMIGSSAIEVVGDHFLVKSSSLSNGYGVCAHERFSAQPAAASCSAFLVGPDLLATAGHCITSDYDCRNYQFVFDYGYLEQSQETGETTFSLPVENLFRCAKIVARELDQGNDLDYAVIKLDRPVVGRQPLSFRTSGKIEDDAKLVVIGHPTGLPTKISDGANVRNNNDRIYFTANLDTYGGNSGSAVLNTESGKVEGILVRGETDYLYDRENGCKISNHCEDNGCRGEDVTRITQVKGLRWTPNL